MSADVSPPDSDLVVRCACKHKPPQNALCQFVPAVSCGGPSKCRICQIPEPAEPAPLPLGAVVQVGPVTLDLGLVSGHELLSLLSALKTEATRRKSFLATKSTP